MKLEPTDPTSIAALLRDAEYGFARDDTDGYTFAQECVKLASALANPPRFTYRQVGATYWHIYDNGCAIASTCTPGVADRLVEALKAHHKEDA